LTAANGLADDYSEFKNSVMLRVPGLARHYSGRCRIGDLRRLLLRRWCSFWSGRLPSAPPSRRAGLQDAWRRFLCAARGVARPACASRWRASIAEGSCARRRHAVLLHLPQRDRLVMYLPTGARPPAFLTHCRGAVR